MTTSATGPGVPEERISMARHAVNCRNFALSEGVQYK
jgi:hypothetical protein